LTAKDIESIIIDVSGKVGVTTSASDPFISFVDSEYHVRFTSAYPSMETQRRGLINIRKQPAEPITILDIISSGSLSVEDAAVLWWTIKHKMAVLIVGHMKTGKTTLLTALTGFIPPGSRVLTIEDAPEIRCPRHVIHFSTVPISHQYFDILKWSLRSSADYVVVGEVRGEEARVWAQAISTGHGGLTTFHSDHPGAAVTRLTTPPINIPIQVVRELAIIVFITLTSFGRKMRLYGFDENVNVVETDHTSVFDLPKYRNVMRTYRMSKSEAVSELNHLIDALNIVLEKNKEKRLSFDEAAAELYATVRYSV